MLLHIICRSLINEGLYRVSNPIQKQSKNSSPQITYHYIPSLSNSNTAKCRWVNKWKDYPYRNEQKEKFVKRKRRKKITGGIWEVYADNHFQSHLPNLWSCFMRLRPAFLCLQPFYPSYHFAPFTFLFIQIYANKQIPRRCRGVEAIKALRNFGAWKTVSCASFSHHKSHGSKYIYTCHWRENSFSKLSEKHPFNECKFKQVNWRFSDSF